MVFQASILLILGIIFLFLGWRWRNPPDTDIIAALKGLAMLKKEMKDLKEDVKYIDAKVDQTVAILLEEKNPYTPVSEQNDQSAEIIEPKENIPERASRSKNQFFKISNNITVLPEKYREVLDLAEQGLSVAEIADRLSISQDAVTMVLSTSAKRVNEL